MIPDYQTLMLPLLKIVSDGKEYKVNDVVEILSQQFNLTEQERAELLPSGQSFLFSNRVGWAKTYLKKAGLLDAPKRAIISITDRGNEVLNENPSQITDKFLQKFPEFLEFKSAKKDRSHPSIKSLFDDKSESTKQIVNYTVTPEEQIEHGYQEIHQSLKDEVLSKLKSIHPSFFEKIVVQLLVKMGYGGSIEEAGKATRYTNDEGIDGIIKEDKLGLDVIYIQAKRWEGVVSRPEIQKFVGALAGQRAKKGVFITTSDFSKEAMVYASQMDTKIVLIDGETLAQYMIDYNLGVSIQNSYEIKKLDSDYFEEQ